MTEQARQEFVETKSATVSKDDNGVVIITLKEAPEVDEHDIADLHLVIRQVSEFRPALKLVISNARYSLTKNGRKAAEDEEKITGTRARAIVVSSGIKASFMNLLKQFGDHNYPQQFFDKREDAYRWLLQFREQGLDRLQF